MSWNPVDGANGYKVQWKSGEQEYDPATREASVSGADTTSHTIPGLTPGVEYTVRVIATSSNAPDGEPSDEATGTPMGGAPSHQRDRDAGRGEPHRVLEPG